MKSLKMLLLLILMCLPVIAASNASSFDDSECSNYEFIFARGSGQELNGPDFKSYKSVIEEKLKDQKISFYELGEKGGGYPAVAADFLVSLGAIVSAGESYRFGDSIDKGADELISRVQSESKRCKNKKFILSGFSQGAIVIDKALNYLNSEKIFYAANFGDPKLYLPEGKRACKQIGLSNYRVYVPDCNVEEGVLDGLKPYQPAGYYNKLGAWCNKKDIMCGSSLDIAHPIKAHTSYKTDKNGYKKFAELISEKITKKTDTPKPTDAYYVSSKKRDIAIIYDYSQMASYEFRKDGKSIEDDLKARLVALADNEARIAIYNSYNLYYPNISLEKKIDFTSENLGKKIDQYNIDNRNTFGLTFGLGNNIFSSIVDVANNAKWADGSEREIIILMNSANSGIVSNDGTSHEDAINAAKAANAKVSVMSINGIENSIFYQAIAKSTGGVIIGHDYSKIIQDRNKAKKLISKTFDINQMSKYTLVAINNMVYGLSDRKSITITDLNAYTNNMISLIGYDASGKKENVRIINLNSNKIKAPDTGAI